MMARDMIVIYGDETFRQWLRGLAKMGERIPQASVDEWNDACEVLFGATQQYAHVLSGDMLSSGRLKVEREGLTVVGTITYGGGQRTNIPSHWKHQEIDYTPFELARRGSHDFIERAVVKTIPRLEEAAGKMVEIAFREAMTR